jgi:16S rRNA (cytosine967-C5)-methyltransferase
MFRSQRNCAMAGRHPQERTLDMTPAARVAAAIDVIDSILAGVPAERALTGWARRSRFAGAKDRAALRDLVFDALRRRRSYAAAGGAETGRGLMLGALRLAGTDPEVVFTGEGHAPARLRDEERAIAVRLADLPAPIRLDVPDWLYPRFVASLGVQADAALAALRDRAPVHLRVNIRSGDRAQAVAALAADGIQATPHPEVRTALQVVENPRMVQQSAAYLQGLVELQDAASQAAMLRLPLASGQQVLDYCAGGGGKALAIRAREDVCVTAHDINPRRMADLPDRAARAGIVIDMATAPDLSPQSFDLVLCDAPCSGSGTWRRAPDAKWRLTPETFRALQATQDDVLRAAAPLVRPGGTLAYATCSVLDEENRARVDTFLAASAGQGWTLTDEMRLLPSQLWDGFYLACLTRRV